MRQIVILSKIILTLLLLSACNSNSEEYADDTEQIRINLRLYDPSNESASSNTRDLLTSDVKYVNYFVFDHTTGQLVKKMGIQRDSHENGNFGKLYENLPAGDYNMVILASTNNVPFMQGTLFQDMHIQMANYSNDIFYCSCEIHLDKLSQARDLELERITGKVEIVISDAQYAPYDVANIQLYMNTSTPSMFMFQNKRTFNVPNSGGANNISYTPVGRNVNGNDINKINSSNPMYFYAFDNTNWQGLNNDLYAMIEKTDGSVEMKLIKTSLQIKTNQVIRLEGYLFKYYDTEQTPIDIQKDWTVSEHMPFLNALHY